VDEDLEAMTREQLIAEARRLRAGIRTHRDSTGHALCWHHPALWGLLAEKTDPLPTVPTWPEFLRSVTRKWRSSGLSPSGCDGAAVFRDQRLVESRDW